MFFGYVFGVNGTSRETVNGASANPEVGEVEGSILPSARQFEKKVSE
jgi:hypothetical protein